MKPLPIKQLDYNKWRVEIDHLNSLKTPEFPSMKWGTEAEVVKSITIMETFVSIVRALVKSYSNLISIENRSSTPGSGSVLDWCSLFINNLERIFEEYRPYFKDYEIVASKARILARNVRIFISNNETQMLVSPFGNDLIAVVELLKKLPNKLDKMALRAEEIVQQTRLGK